MRQNLILSILLAVLVLSGCGGSSGQPEADSPIPGQTTAPVTTAATEPPDPMQMLLDAMSTEEKVGQLFLARCPRENAGQDIAELHLGGFILFAEDFEGQTPDSLRDILAGYQSHSPIPMLFAVDEEGGNVCRISRFPAFRASRFPSPRTAYHAGGMEQVLSVEREKAALLQELGIHVNMAPVCDMASEPGSFLYDRSLGQDAETCGRFVSGTVRILSEYRVGSVLKHFPGYGNNADTHTGIVRDSRSLEELESRDLIPFARGIEAGCDAILVSHTIVEIMDPDLPASLSPEVHTYLRETMGFEGVIVTDDLVMQAVTDAYGPEEAAVLAVLAGNDLLCSTEYRVQYNAVLEAVSEGRISLEQLDASVLRVLGWKRELGLIF